MSPPRRALIAVTSAQATLFQGKETTGLFISEALHPFKVLTAAGFEVDLASETGSYTPDWLSQQPDFLSGEDLTIWNDTNSDFRKKLDNMPRAADVDGARYGVFYASAGHAALIDYPTATNLQRIASQVWANGGVVSSVCHGPAIFHGVVDLATNEPLIKGKAITGFTTEAEVTMGIMAELRAWNSPMVEELAEKLGATHTSALLAFGTTSTLLMAVWSAVRTRRVQLRLPAPWLRYLRHSEADGMVFLSRFPLSRCI
ncbi:class I glutamine amidotransferase-like protein [Parathielavia appendiculata]|uniref:D-lactate dehydratase n=1 Tax=Parathielavia appendiculata TaxID=2587402 RepID=A0AAN6TV94_9PEZI|nr:class I glutamine amidotransferase-like protein [Parathielavia appendiculata]